MRKIISKKNEENKLKRTQLILGLLLVGIMLLSILGYAFGEQGKEKEVKINYNGFEFLNKNEFWYTRIGNFYFVFKNNPLQVPEISTNLNTIDSYVNKPLYVYSENRDSEIEIYRNLDPNMNSIVQRIQTACLKGEECKESTLPVKTCEENFILIKEAEESSISQKENCVFIEGKEEELVKLTDKALFKILTIE